MLELLGQVETTSTAIGLISQFGLAAFVGYIIVRYILPKLDAINESIQALAIALAKKFDISADELAKAKAELRLINKSQ